MNGCRRGWLAAAVLVALGASVARAEDPLFAGAEKFSKGSSSSSKVDLDKSMLAAGGPMLGGLGLLGGKMDSVYVLTYDYPAEGAYKMADVEEFEKRLNASDCKHIVEERSASESSDICVKLDGEGHWRDMVVISAEAKELSFIHLKGQLSMLSLNTLSMFGASGMGVPQLQHRVH